MPMLFILRFISFVTRWSCFTLIRFLLLGLIPQNHRCCFYLLRSFLFFFFLFSLSFHYVSNIQKYLYYFYPFSVLIFCFPVVEFVLFLSVSLCESHFLILNSIFMSYIKKLWLFRSIHLSHN